MILSNAASVYWALRPSTVATASMRSTSNPTIFPLESLNSFGAYGTFTPTISLPEDLILSGTRAAIESTLATAALDEPPPLAPPPAAGGVEVSVLLEHAVSNRALTANDAVMMDRARECFDTEGPPECDGLAQSRPPDAGGSR